MNCDLCNRDFKGKRGCSKHLQQKHKMSFKEIQSYYLVKKYKKENLIQCEICKLFFKTLQFHISAHGMLYQDYLKHHSKDTISKIYLNSMINGVKEKYKHTSKKELQEIAKKINNTIREKYGKHPGGRKKGFKHTKEFIDLKRKDMLEWQAAYMNQFIKNPSKPQITLFELVCSVLPYPIMNYPCDNYSIDIAVPKLNLAIEYDGSYWHKNKEYDDKRQKYIENKGWIFIRFRDYTPNRNELLEEVKKIIGE